ncbi:MAG: fumarylacetoacetate hydrolase family protein [Pseudohongiellaceae bacterium]
MDFIIPAAEIKTLPVLGSTRRFPVHRVYCVGRNYADHVREMGNDPAGEPPLFFSKPTDAVVTDNGDVHYPPRTRDLHHEVEMVIALGKGGSNIAVEDAADCVFGYGVGIDFTRRDLQKLAKKLAGPWDLAKGFDDSAAISALHPVSDMGHPHDGEITLEVNGQLRQKGSLEDMIWSVPEIIAELSTYYVLTPGDIIFSGTPAGVGPVKQGDRLEAGITGIASLQCDIVAPRAALP